MKVVVLGASGMLGSTVARVLGAVPELELSVTCRAPVDLRHSDLHELEARTLDVCTCSGNELVEVLKGADWAINCIGLIKPYIHDGNPAESEAALRINALFPHLLTAVAERTGCRILQIATDCVYSGQKGAYTETDPHDAWDVYGKTKSLGEVASPWMHHLRCSIIGPEFKSRLSLLEWFLGQGRGATVKGYTNHRWNGITTLHFARLCQGVITGATIPPGLCHVLPAEALSKAQLLGLMAEAFGRRDINIQPLPAAESIDRTLDTTRPDLNLALWGAAGYASPPGLGQMLEELAAWSKAAGRVHP
jgi:dTDP-4-dehydrorhamnose reductase